ncbi:BTAD domain-containing putative transcriptional regulator [Lentzea sp. BCCO 10_0061]|uniref:BTAD domain-containing putative transcriptional regulator n=1 Tax=Lentzea sokolovensis TaxID=3095429 RepID=A0ABU4V7I4_9PSEU|nr:BTAD domain-containing putative transcriptional regulator [Lentzea sp. BCCO 10_0061]MDX8147435.1 BTAD domain-containing putative transcriptional regulator [Lentzea sp. BCCO 10_0061]
MVTFGVLGPLTAGSARLGGPKQRAVLARLLVARRRVVPVRTLVADLWEEPPDGALGTVQTFVGALRKALEPDRPPRTPSSLLVTEGAGYALLADDVDAWRFEEMLGGDLSVLDSALALWRGPAYGEFADEHWARAEIDRLEELRLVAVERRAEAALALGRAAGVVADLRAHLADHPWREKAWSLLALALYREGRQGDALEAVREARHALVENLGVDPGAELRALEADILAQSPRLRPSPVSSLVGRATELALLETAVPAAGLGIALVTGEAGVGKTALATAFAELLTGRGWRTVWARCQEDAPVAWPWQQVVEALGEELGAADRFRLRLAIVSTVESAAPVLVVLDDLHQADEETLAVLAAFTGHRFSGRVLIVATSRTAVPLEALARAEPVRVELGGLDEEAVAALVGAKNAVAIHERSGGNPFYAKELGRLVASGGDLGSVPAGVRDVLRHRLAGLPAQARSVLHQASVLGRDVEVDLLAALAGHDVLDALDRAIEAGFVVEVAPGHARFTHALVRDTVYEDVSLTRRARWHEAVAVAEALRPGDVQTIAHHYGLAGTKSAAAANALTEAAEQTRSPREAVRLWRAAIAAGSERLTGLVRALAVSGDLAAAREQRSAALRLASSPRELAEVIGSYDVPGIWTTNDDPAHSAELIAAAERTLPAFPGPTATRARLLATIAMEDRGTSARLGEAREAEAIARDLGDPVLRAFALNARFMHTFRRTGLAHERATIGRELLEVATDVTYEVLGHLILVQACSALADFSTADVHAAAADDLARRHDLPLVGVFTDWYAALKLTAAGKTAEADRAYRAAADRIRGTGMWGMERGLLPLALLSVHGPSTVDLDDDWGPLLDWVRPLALPRDEALAAARALPDGPADLLTEVRACLLAMAATRLRDDELRERAHALLLPAKDELVAGTGLFTFGPVTDYLRG